MTTATTIEIPFGTWSVDPVHSRVEFEVDHLGLAPFRGEFGDYSVELTSGDDGIGVEGTAEVRSVRVDDEGLEGHLLSPEFFDAERHPQIAFRSTRLEYAGDGELRVDGELTIRGETREVSASGRIAAPGVDPGGDRRVPVILEAVVDRHDYGLDWNADLPNGGKALGDEVTIRVSLELVEGAE